MVQVEGHPSVQPSLVGSLCARACSSGLQPVPRRRQAGLGGYPVDRGSPAPGYGEHSRPVSTLPPSQLALCVQPRPDPWPLTLASLSSPVLRSCQPGPSVAHRPLMLLLLGPSPLLLWAEGSQFSSCSAVSHTQWAFKNCSLLQKMKTADS